MFNSEAWTSCVSCLPIVVLGQRHLLKMNVEPLSLRGLEQPVARQVVAVVTGETGGDDAAHIDVLHQSSAGGWQEDQGEDEWEIPLNMMSSSTSTSTIMCIMCALHTMSWMFSLSLNLWILWFPLRHAYVILCLMCI